MKRGVASVALAVMLTGGAAAGPLEDGTPAHGRRDYATALRLWRPLAEKGDAAAQWPLGMLYRFGLGVPRNYAEAVKWYRLAAEQGFDAAQHDLGDMYYLGWGVPGRRYVEDD